tara:strand:- start:1762 stop:1998 length:237 start_codon:yes stop_codon:yes gene_type:complete
LIVSSKKKAFDINEEPQTVFDILLSKIRENMNAVSDSVSTGGAHDFGQYQRMVGQIEGFALAEREILDLRDRYYKDEE